MNANNTTEGVPESGSSREPDPLLVLPVVLSVLWIVLYLFYASSILGFLVNRLANLFLKDSGIHVGSLHINLLTGRVLFRDLHYYCRDYSIRVTDGYAVLRWWKKGSLSACPECTSCGGKKSVQSTSAFVFFQLNGFEYHWYNRSDVYDNWGKPKVDENLDNEGDSEESGFWAVLNRMQPSLHISFKKSRLVFGNHLIEKSLVVYSDKAEAHYSTTEASNPYDELMHVVDWHGDNVRAVLEPSPGYETEEIPERPPLSYNGNEDIYPLLKTDSAKVTYSWDSPGIVPLGDTRGPKYAYDVQLGTNTVVNFGCYAHRQRTILQKFFFPNDYTEAPVTHYPQPGEKRVYLFFDIAVSLSSPGTFNIYFNDKQKLNHLSLCLAGESSVTISQPFTTNEDGYTTTVTGRLSQLRVNSSLDYKTVGRADTVEFKTDLHFPRIWNATQTWDLRFDGNKVQANILFSYIDFVNALLDDWLGDDPNDLLHFGSFNVNIDVDLSEYEIYLFTNRYNWVDKDGLENSRIGFCGTTGQLRLEFPFTEFNPPEQKIVFTAHGQNIVVRHYVPPSCSTRESLFALSSANKHRWRVMEFQEEPKPPREREKREPPSVAHSASSSPSLRSKTKASTLTLDSEQDRDPPSLKPKGASRFWIGDGASGSLDDGLGKPAEQSAGRTEDSSAPGELPDNELFPMGYRGETIYQSGWLDFACGPTIAISITYYGHNHDAEPGEQLKLKPNVLSIDVDAPAVVFRVFGCFARDLLALKENYPGEYVNFKAFHSTVPYCPQAEERTDKPVFRDTPPPPPLDCPDEPDERTIDLYVDFKLHNITAEFPTHLPEGYPRDFPLPSFHTSVLAVHVEYVGCETKVLLHVDPFTVHVPSVVFPQNGGEPVYELGNVACTGIDFNCHGFTEYMCQERVEYAWLMQLLVGRIMGAASTEQLLQAVDWLQTAVIHTLSHGDEFKEAPGAELIEPKVEPLSEIIKYRLFDLKILEADVHILEGNTLTRLQSPGFDLDLCDLHSEAETLGLSLQLHGLTATSYIPAKSDPSCMLECGLLDVGNIQGDLNLREIEECVPKRQLDFLRKADRKTRRLWFLWKEEEGLSPMGGEIQCGCCGGCLFLEGCIERLLPREKMESVVYSQQLSCSDSASVTTASKSLGLQTLKKVLSTLSVKELECVLSLHQGLLGHYELRYGKLNDNAKETDELARVGESTEGSPEVSMISDGSFVSARSSLTSLTEGDDQFMSIENINEAGLEGIARLTVAEGKRIRHRKRASAMSRELKAMAASAGGKDTVDAPADFSLSAANSYKDIAPSQTYKPAVLYVPLKKREAEPERKPQQPQQMTDSPMMIRAEIHTDRESLQTQDSSTAIFPRQSTMRSARTRNALRLRIPLFAPLSQGKLPIMVQNHPRTPRKAREKQKRSATGQDGRPTNERKLAKFSLSVLVKGNLTATLTPPVLGFFDKVTRSIGGFFERRSGLAILDVFTNDSNSAVQSHIANLLENSFTSSTEPQPPLLHLSLSNGPGAFVGVQLLQAPPQLPQLQQKSPTHTTNLKEIASHSSLVSLYLSGLSCNALIQTASELQQPPEEGQPDENNENNESSRRSSPEPKQGSASSKTKNRTLLNSIKVSVEAKCPTLQAAICALVLNSADSESGTIHKNFPGLSSNQSDLDFQFSIPEGSSESEEKSAKVTLCDLLELGVRDASVTCVGKVIHSEVSEEAILTWNNVRNFQLSNPTSIPKSDDHEMKNNKLVVAASLPSLWCQLAAPHTGIASSSTGGLDVLILSEAVDAWRPAVEHLIELAKLLPGRKEARDKRVLLAHLSNAARSAIYKKLTTPLLSNTSSTLRETVVYNCVLQLWNAFPAFSEQMLSSMPDEHSCDEEIVAIALGLAARLYSEQEAISRKKLRLRAAPERTVSVFSSRGAGSSKPEGSDTESLCSTGYISISPSPSELAMPNQVFSGSQHLEDVDYMALFEKLQFGNLVVVKESLLPLLQTAGVQMEPQLRSLCHNSAEFFADFTVELREATIFAVESIQTEHTVSKQSSAHLNTIPALLVKEFAITGCLKYSSESSLRKSPNLSLLTRNSVTEEQLQKATDSKVNVSSQCCISLDTISTNITVPLLKFGRHMIETGKFRSLWKFHKEVVESEADAVKLKTLDVPGAEHVSIPIDEPDAGEIVLASHGPGPENVWEFSQNVISFLSVVENEAIPLGTPGKLVRSTTPQSTASSLHSTRPRMYDFSHSPRYPRTHIVSFSDKDSKSHLTVPTLETHTDSSAVGPREKPLDREHKRMSSTASNTSITSGEIAINIEETDAAVTEQRFGTSPDEQVSTQDTYGGDTTDSQHLASSDNDVLVSGSSPILVGSYLESLHSHSEPRSSSALGVMGMSSIFPLQSEEELLYSVFGLLKINSIQFSFQVETTKMSLELTSISGSVDARKVALGSASTRTFNPAHSARSSSGNKSEESKSLIDEVLPTYLSVAFTLNKSLLRISDRDSELIQFSARPVYCSTGISSARLPVTAYRCLFKVSGLELNVKQSPVKMHMRFQQLMPAFTKIYNNVFAPSCGDVVDPSLFLPSSTSTKGMSEVKLPAKLPQGFIHFSLDKTTVYMAPLPSLSVTYSVAPVTAQVETSTHINFSLGIGDHSLRFIPREHRDELSLRYISLPTISLKGDVKSRHNIKLPRVSVELAIKQVNIDVTTDVLNQLLILQNTFIKELNELVQLFINIGESIPHRERLERLASIHRKEQPASVGSEVELLSFLDSCKFSLSGVCITVSTPLSTALRFSTGKIDMLLTSTGSSFLPGSTLKSQLLLSGRVEIDISLALGYLQDSGPDVVDDFCELAYFRTRISVRNTQQNVTRRSLGHEEQRTDSAPMIMETFLISILSPHLYIQSTAVEQAILFWLNCKSVYSYWQNERTQLNEEVQEATEAFIKKIHPPTQPQTPSLDFPKPRLVQITVSDMGACMPLTLLPTTPHNTQKAFPALVLTVKDMQLVMNFSHKVASSGNFSGFCLRFAEQFYQRHKTWTMDSRKHKFTNCGTVNQGTFRLCIATKKTYAEADPSVVLGERLVTAFQWDMSGIDVYANTIIGRHISTLVRTMTTIGSNLEGKETMKRSRSGSNLPAMKLQPPRPPYRRAMSTPRVPYHRKTLSLTHAPSPMGLEESYKYTLEQDLARQTRKVLKLKYSGATGESLKFEEDALRQLEHDLAREVGRMLRKPRKSGISFQTLNQIFSPKALTPGREQEGGFLKRRFSHASHGVMVPSARRRIISAGDQTIAEEPIPERSETESPQMRPRAQTVSGVKPTHGRTKSDITDIVQYMRKEEEREGSQSPMSDRFSRTPTPVDERVFPARSSTPGSEGSRQEGREQEVEYAIDVEVNVTISVDSGIIVLHSEEGIERSGSVTQFKTQSPHLRRLHYAQSDKRSFDSTSKHGHSTTDSMLLIPALKVKVHYKSTVGKLYSNAPPSPKKASRSPTPPPISTVVQPPTPTSADGQTTPSTKQRKAVTWGPTDAFVEEVDCEEPPAKRGVLSLSAVVSSLPEDLELTPALLEFIEQVARPTIEATAVTSSSSSTSDSDAENDMDTTSPAVQQPSGERPISFPVDVTLTFQIQPSTVCLSCQPHSRVKCEIRSPDVNFVVSFSLFSKQQLENSLSWNTSSPQVQNSVNEIITFNNLYITGCLTTFALAMYSPQVSTIKQQGSSTPKIENKEALGLTLGQALIHLSRKTVLTRAQGKGVRSVDDYSMHSKLQVSVITDIASLVLGYDMRRLNDVTTFRRYWYRTSLLEALFIGSKKSGEMGTPHGDTRSPPTSGEASTEPSGVTDIDDSISAAIVVAANVADFRIAANVAQVMGNANLLVTHLKCEAHLDISHNELVLFNLDGRMEKGEVDARGGMVAGSILMEEAQTHITTDNKEGSIPEHKATALIQLVEGKVDYMSSCIMLWRATQLEAKFFDSWEGLQLGNMAGEEERPPEASIQIVADFTWNLLQLAIHRSTTKSMFNIVQKMYEFAVQQRRRSERTISLMLPSGTAASKSFAAYREEQKRADEQKEKVDTRHHWKWVTKVGSVELMETMGIPAPEDQPSDVSLGGKITISGQNICVVCFHGTTFRETEWAVFNIDLIGAGFSTQAIPGLGAAASMIDSEEGEGYSQLVPRRTCQQICSVSLGEGQPQSSELGTVYRVLAGRSGVPPITGTNVHDWLAYACIDFHLHPEKYSSPSASRSGLIKFSKKLNVQPVFLIPTLTFKLINDHFWPLATVTNWEAVEEGVERPDIPLVECSLISQFSEGISVTTTVDHYLFLHDLIKGYIDYLERHKAPGLKSPSAVAIPEPTPTPSEKSCHRKFVCVWWELNPHLLLLSTVSGQFNPHIDWLLEKLGFTHARTTIPKWIQRGAMDPLDKVIAKLVELLVKLTASKKLEMRASSPVSEQ